MPPEPSQVSKAGRRLQGPGGRRATRNDLDAVARGWLPVPAPGPAGRSAPLPSAASGGSPVSATMLALRFCLRRADTYHAATSLGARGTFKNVDPSRLITNDAHNYLKVRGANDMIIIKLRPATYDSCARGYRFVRCEVETLILRRRASAIYMHTDSWSALKKAEDHSETLDI